MNILIKDEVDVIEHNIRTHAKLGVDSFVIMNNDSTDGTREKLEELQKYFNILIIDEKGIFDQKKWMTRLAFEAKKKFNPDWTINSDADEFWIPNDGESIKNHIKFKGGVLQIQRSNMIPPTESKEQNNVWFHSVNEVRNQINYRSSYESEASILLGQTSRKVMTNPHGLIKLNSGNHSAEHIAFWQKHESNQMRVYHYPIRSFEQFKKRVKTRKDVLDKNPNVKLGDHERRWKKMFEENRLEQEYEKFIYNLVEIEALKKAGVVIENKLPSQIII
jgi:hypothetical protein